MIIRNNSQGHLYIIAAPSGSGKNTIISRVMAIVPSLAYSVSATTRQARPFEKHAVDYYFLSRTDFEQRIANQDFLEYAEVHGNQYGTLKAEIDRIYQSQCDAVMDIDVQGAMQLRQRDIKATYIFIVPPNFTVLEQRLRDRGTENEEKIRLRIANARKEIKFITKFHHIVLNDILDDAVRDLSSIIFSNRTRLSNFQLDNLQQ